MKQINETRPGVKTGINLFGFSKEEKEIIEFLGRKYWYVTRAQVEHVSNNSLVKLIWIKPTHEITHSFNLCREVIVAFSPYEVFEPRAIDAIDNIDYQGLRTEEVCSFIICKDKEVEAKINQFVKKNQESRIIVPFVYEELLNQQDDEYVNNKIRKFFYSRDLFGIQDPLKKDVFFFGRNELIQELINKHLCGESAGLFGLRKTGKTSIIYGIKRGLDKKRSVAVVVDCQILHLKPWNIALQYIIQLAKEECEVKKTHLQNPDIYLDQQKVADSFQADIKSLYYNNGRKSLLFIFDEIENISYGTSASEEWRSGNSFVKFWQVLRSSFQNSENIIFTYLIAGTNPKCVEQVSINGIDNPIFAQFVPKYIPPFNFNLTTEMLSTIGGYMGLSFSPEVCVHLVEDYGGHPLLIRQMCSFMHNSYTGERPFNVDKVYYSEMKKHFDVEENGFRKYAEMVLEVLKKWYSDEYDMLEFLAIGDEQTFVEFAKESQDYTTHLIKYGLVSYSEHMNKYVINVNTVKEFLCEKNKYRKTHLTDEEKYLEISKRRNTAEPKLRSIVRKQLKASVGEPEAKKIMIKALYGAKGLSEHLCEPYVDFFDSNKHKIYLSTIFNIIYQNYQCFENIFGVNKEVFKNKTDLLNTYRKPDAHAAIISEADFNVFRGTMSWLEEVIEEFG